MIKSAFIHDILMSLLDGDDYYKAIRPQINFISDDSYEFTGVGVFVSFIYIDEIFKHKIKDENIILTGVEIKSSELEIGATATLFFKDGIIDYLEIWSYCGEYPERELADYTLVQQWL